MSNTKDVSDVMLDHVEQMCMSGTIDKTKQVYGPSKYVANSIKRSLISCSNTASEPVSPPPTEAEQLARSLFDMDDEDTSAKEPVQPVLNTISNERKKPDDAAKQQPVDKASEMDGVITTAIAPVPVAKDEPKTTAGTGTETVVSRKRVVSSNDREEEEEEPIDGTRTIVIFASDRGEEVDDDGCGANKITSKDENESSSSSSSSPSEPDEKKRTKVDGDDDDDEEEIDGDDDIDVVDTEENKHIDCDIVCRSDAPPTYDPTSELEKLRILEKRADEKRRQAKKQQQQQPPPTTVIPPKPIDNVEAVMPVDEGSMRKLMCMSSWYRVANAIDAVQSKKGVPERNEFDKWCVDKPYSDWYADGTAALKKLRRWVVARIGSLYSLPTATPEELEQDMRANMPSTVDPSCIVLKAKYGTVSKILMFTVSSPTFFAIDQITDDGGTGDVRIVSADGTTTSSPKESSIITLRVRINRSDATRTFSFIVPNALAKLAMEIHNACHVDVTTRSHRFVDEWAKKNISLVIDRDKTPISLADEQQGEFDALIKRWKQSIAMISTGVA